MRRLYSTLCAIVLMPVASPNLSAQDTIQVGVRSPLAPGEELTAQVARELEAFYNSPTTIRFSSRTRIPADRTIGGNVAILGGPVELAGRSRRRSGRAQRRHSLARGLADQR